MPQLSEHETDAERERAFRRGYAHAANEIVSGVVERLSEKDRKEVNEWYRLRLIPWTLDASLSKFEAPPFPTLT